MEPVDYLDLRVRLCETPSKLAELLKLQKVEVMAYRGEFYEGESTYGVLINTREDFEKMEMAIKLNEIEGHFGEACNKDGEVFYTFDRLSGGYDDYQKKLRDQFEMGHYFYNSIEDDAQFVLEEIQSKEETKSIARVKEILKKWEQIEDGYYDEDNKKLIILAKDLQSDELTGYRQNACTYNFCFKFAYKYNWHGKEQSELEKLIRRMPSEGPKCHLVNALDSRYLSNDVIVTDIAKSYKGLTDLHIYYKGEKIATTQSGVPNTAGGWCFRATIDGIDVIRRIAGTSYRCGWREIVPETPERSLRTEMRVFIELK